MTANTSPIFTLTPNVGLAALSATADAASATSGSTITPTASSFVTLFTAGTNGSRVEEIDCTGTGTTVAGLIRIYIYNGTSYYLWQTVIVPAVVPSTTLGNWNFTVPGVNNLVLKSGLTLVVSSTVASQLVNVVALGGDF